MDIGQIVKIAVLALLAIDLAFIIMKGDEWRDFYSNLSLRLFLVGAATLVVVVTAYYTLFTYIPGMSLSWLNLFGSEGKNIVGFSNEVKYLGIIFLVLLFFALPKLAIIEEELFRAGTRNWTGGYIRSLIFGLIHMVMGVPLGAALAITIAGLVFTYQYFRGGVRLAALTHFHYNLIAVGYLLVSAVLFSF